MLTSDLATVDDHAAAARARLPIEVADHIDAAAGDERAIGRARAAFDAMVVRPRVLRAMDGFDAGTTVIGQRVALPVLLAPTGSHGIAHPDAEVASVAAAGDAGTIMVVSSGSTLPTRQVVAAATSALWYQTYLYRDRNLTDRALDLAADAGFAAICLTVDALGTPVRARDRRHGYAPPPSPNLQHVARAPSEDPVPTAAILPRLDWSATWDDLASVCTRSTMPVVIKGVLDPGDAARAVEAGVAAIIVSDHGGRIHGEAVAPIDALPEIVDAVAGRAEVLVDGGVRHGSDILKALAVGATATLVGRPVLWGLANGGRAGVLAVLDILRAEFEAAMVASGVHCVGDLDRDMIGWTGPRLRWGRP